MRKISTAIAVGSLAFLAGCATMQSHDSKVGAAQASAESGSVSAALQQLEASASSDSAKKEFLFNLERAELLRLAQRYIDSTAS
ncbi:MAG: hypothetical protein ACKOF9_02900 [Burkholderiales bacterium]